MISVVICVVYNFLLFLVTMYRYFILRVKESRYILSLHATYKVLIPTPRYSWHTRYIRFISSRQINYYGITFQDRSKWTSPYVTQ